MGEEQAAPETKGVTTDLLATVDLGPEIEGMAGRQLRMRMVTIEPGGVFGPVHDHRGRPELRTMGREWVGPRIGTPHTGSRTEERAGRWRSPSISSGTNKVEPETYA
jgi:hypothetical protein